MVKKGPPEAVRSREGVRLCPLAGAVGYLTSMRILVARLRASGTAVSRCVAPTGSFPKLAVGILILAFVFVGVKYRLQN